MSSFCSSLSVAAHVSAKPETLGHFILHGIFVIPEKRTPFFETL